MKLYVHVANSFLNDPKADISILKEILKNETGKSFRRINRFVYLALIGSLGLANKTNIDKDTAIYLATNYGSLASTISSLADVYEAKSLPMPVDFINTASNIAGFYVASELGLISKNICISAGERSFEAALELAALDIASGELKSAIIGGVDEVVASLSGIYEGSCWLSVSASADGAIGEISFDKDMEDSDIVSFAVGFDAVEQARIANGREVINFYKEFGYYGSYSAFAISYFLNNFRNRSMCFVSHGNMVKVCALNTHTF
jgi:hypothetical protein